MPSSDRWSKSSGAQSPTSSQSLPHCHPLCCAMSASAASAVQSASAAAAAQMLVLAPTAEHNASNTVKANKRVQAIVEKHRVFEEPQRLDPDTVGVSPFNRGGSAPNMPYIHSALQQMVTRDGFDPKRPQAGFVILHETSDSQAGLVAFNEKLADGCDLYPPVFGKGMKYGSLASSHLTLALRCWKNTVHSSITGARFQVPADDDALKHVVSQGHSYFVLDDKISKEDAEFLSEWRNADQNQNQCNSEAQLIRTLQSLVEDELAKSDAGTQVKLSTIISKATNKSIVKLKPDTVGGLTRWILSLGARDYVTEFLDFHAAEVDPTQLTVPWGFFDEVAKALGKEFVLSKLAITVAQYTSEGAQAQTRPQPDTCRLTSHSELHALGRNTDVLKALEAKLAETRQKMQPLLTEAVGGKRARVLLRTFETQVVRLALAKKQLKTFNSKVSGRFSPEKVDELRHNWLLYLQGLGSASLSNIGNETGFLLAIEPDADEAARERATERERERERTTLNNQT